MTVRTHRNWLEASLAFLLAAALLVVAPGSVPEARAATLTVDQNDAGCNAGGPVYCTINSAIGGAINGDTIQVAPGTYVESIGIFSQVLTIESTGGPSVTTIQATGPEALILGVNTGTITLDGFTLTGANRTGGNVGGAVWVNNAAGTLTVIDSVITGNSNQFRGGGILNWGTLTVIDSVITNNSAADGGGIHNARTATIVDSTISGNSATYGGGVYHVNQGLLAPHTLDISGSTIDNNFASQRGGGIWAGATTASLTVANSTISGNTAGAFGAAGAGIFNESPSVIVSGSTVALNVAPNGLGGGLANTSNANPLSVIRTILALNTGGATHPDCYSTDSSTSGFLGPNLLGVYGGVNSCEALPGLNPDLQSGTPGSPLDPVISALADNGGLTLTHAISSLSPARDAGGIALCELTDQRGIARPQGPACDIGAFELEPVSLQALIDLASAGAIIDVDPGVYNETITIGDGKTLRGTGAAPADVVIDALAAGTTVTITGDASLENLTIDGGSSPTDGGGIQVAGSELTVDLTDVQVVGNDANANGGGMWVASDSTVFMVDSVFSANIANDDGGGIYLAPGASVDVTGGTFENNIGRFDGAGIYSDGGFVTIAGTVFDNNDTDPTASEGTGSGGAIHNAAGDVLVLAGSFINNDSDSGGAIYSSGTLDIGPAASCTAPVPDIFSFTGDVTFGDNTASQGGAIYNDGSMSISETEFTNNAADFDGGAVLESVFVESETLVTCSVFTNNEAFGNGGAYYGNTAAGGGTQVFQFDSFFDNTAGTYGGAMLTLSPDATVDSSLFDTNAADVGGAIYNDFNLTVTGSTLVGNIASGGIASGGAIHSDDTLTVIDSTVSGNTANFGGGIYALGMTMQRSTVEGNVALGGEGTTGGGILGQAGTFDITNSTLSGNGAQGNGGGLGLTGGTATINNVTAANNAATGQGGAFNGDPGTMIRISNSLAAGNSNGSGGPNCSSLVSLGNNVRGSNPSGCTVQSTDIVGPALIGPLADNGGPTLTHALGAGSAAIDGGYVPFEYPVFDGTTLSDWQLNGFADGDAGQLLLAAPDPLVFNVGSAFVADTVATGQDFSAQFDFQIVPEAGGGADGITFTIGDDPTALGQGGGFLGLAYYDGIEGVIIPVIDGVSVEFDTWVNGSGEGANDPDGNHIGIDVDGNLSSVALTSMGAANLSDGSVWTAWIDYNSDTTTLEVRASNTGSRPVAATVSAVVDIGSLAGPSAYVGFTGATGSSGISGEQRVLNFSLTEESVCAATDQRGIARPQNAACDIGAYELDVPPALTLSLNTDPVVPSGASTIATASLPSDLATQPTDPADPTDDNIGSAPIANLDTQSTAAESSPIANLPIANLDIAGAPIANLPIANLAPAAQEIVDAILLVDVPIAGGWEDHLAASPALIGRPVQSVTFGQAMADPAVLGSLEDAGLTFNDMNLASTPIANLTIAGLALGNLPIANLPIANLAPGASTVEILQAWCDALAQQPVNCGTLDIFPAAGDDGGHSLASLSIAGADLSTLPIANIPIANLDTASAPIANLPIANLPIANLVLADSPIANLPIANLPIANLGPSGLPIANLPIADLPIANLVLVGSPIANLPIANLPIANLPIANLRVQGQPIANLPIANLEVNGLPIANLGPNGLPIANLPIANLPIANLPIANLAFVDCSAPGVFDCDAPGATIGGAYIAGALSGSLEDWVAVLTIDDLLALGVTDAAGTLITDADFLILFDGLVLGDLANALGYANTGQITLNELGDLLGMTLGELIVALIQSGLDVELGDVLLLLVNPEDYPWEDLDLEGIDLQKFDTSALPTVFSAEVDVTNGGSAPGEIAVTLPDGFLFTGVDVTGPGGVLPYTFSVTGQTVVVNLTATPDGLTTVDVESAASLGLGAAAATSSVTVGALQANAGTVLQVVEVLEPNDTPAAATAADEDILYLTHIAEQTDIDMYKIEGVQPGDRISVILSNMAEDFDLVLYQPELPPLRPGGVTPEGIATGVTDPGGFIDGDEQIQNEVSGDFPRATFADGTPLRLYETSTQQGTSDEVITTATLQAAGTYYVQVHGNNGATSADPYALRLEKVESPTSLACSPLIKPFDGQGSVGAVFPANPGTPNTLFIYNEERLGDLYGAGAAGNVRDALHGLAGQSGLGVDGIVVPVEFDVDVATAYTAWDADRCNPLAANAVAAQIGQLVDDYRTQYPTIESITVVGDDAQIPFFRVPDNTEIANESEYALSVSATNNELVGSLLSGFVLTDDPYGDAHPLLIDGRELYVSELPLGRLVETPSQIIQSVDHFVEFDGRLDPGTTSTGLSTGYDFIEDGANAIQSALDDNDPRRTTTTLNSDNPGPLWDAAALSSTIDSLAANVVSLGAHMAHDGLLSALEDSAGTQADLYEPIDAQNQIADILKGRVIFSMGCHSGLSVSDVQVGGATPDWAETFSDLGSVYAAETGFGYGDTEIVAYGEELMRQFAGRLNGSMTIGEAMQFAKQFHAANVSQYSPYDEKVIMETVVYGLPFYEIGDPTSPPPAPPILPAGTDPATGLTVVSTSFDYGDGAPGPDGQFLLESGGDRGEFYTAQGDAQATAFNPIQPKATANVTQPGLVGTGVFISELTSVDKPNFDPVFSRPTVDLAAREPELSLPGTFPLVLPGINAYLDFDGERDQLVVVLGQFTDTDGRGKIGTERLFTHVQANVLYGDPSDLLVPTIRSAKAIDTGAGGLLSFTVDAFDQNGTSPGVTDVARVYVLYKLVGTDGAWSQLDLTNVGGRWVGAVPSLGGKVQFIMQAVDFNGLVGFHSNKTAGNVSTDAPAPQPGGVEIVVNGTQAQPGIYTTDPVNIEIVGAAAGSPVEVDVDGAGFEPYTGPFPVSGEGPHVVTVDDGSGELEVIVFVIDTMAPEIFISSPLDGELYDIGSDLHARFSCTDAGAGIANCDGVLDGSPIADGDPIPTLTAGTHTLSVSAEDNLGHAAGPVSVTFEVADLLAVTPLLLAIDSSATGTARFSATAESVVWNWGDGGSDTCTAGDTCFDGVTGTSTLSHTYVSTGVFVVTATITHQDGRTLILESDFVVVYDPTAGFVTGGGWFNSPAGAYTPDPAVAGKAHFGFVSKYKKGATVPTGNTTFKLDANGFKFKSTSYEWLVVSGKAKAQYQGVGTIEGLPGEYGFRITLRDADGNDNDSFIDDAIRVRIWEQGGATIYDNGAGQAEDSEHGGTQPLDGGSVVIHVPKGGKGPK